MLFIRSYIYFYAVIRFHFEMRQKLFDFIKNIDRKKQPSDLLIRFYEVHIGKNWRHFMWMLQTLFEPCYVTLSAFKQIINL